MRPALRHFLIPSICRINYAGTATTLSFEEQLNAARRFLFCSQTQLPQCHQFIFPQVVQLNVIYKTIQQWSKFLKVYHGQKLKTKNWPTVCHSLLPDFFFNPFLVNRLTHCFTNFSQLGLFFSPLWNRLQRFNFFSHLPEKQYMYMVTTVER